MEAAREAGAAHPPVDALLETLELHNFKSYGGTTCIGPLRRFSAVIGPNGAGKSNLMDAIAFVLGVSTRALRGTQLNDLVHRGKDESRSHWEAKTAWVQITVRLEDAGTHIKLRRQVSAKHASQSEYYVDGRQSTYDAYKTRLESLGLRAKTRNFLVFQNEVEAVAMRSAKQLTELFEQVSGSVELKAEYERIAAAREQAEQDTLFAFKKKKGMSAEKKMLKVQREEAAAFQALQDELADARVQLYLFRLFHISRARATNDADLEETSAAVADAERTVASLEQALAGAKRNVASYNKARTLLSGKVSAKKSRLQAAQPELARVGAEMKQMQHKVTKQQAALTKRKEHTDAQACEINALKNALDEVDATLARLNTEMQVAEASERRVTQDDIDAYHALKQRAASESSSVQQQLDAARRRELILTQRHKSAALRNAEWRTRMQTAREEIAKLEARCANLAQQKRRAETDAQRAADVLSAVVLMQGERARKRAELQRSVDECTDSLRAAKVDARDDSRERKLTEAYDNMQRLFPGIRGRLSELCKPVHSRYREAVAVVFGKLMDAIVVDTEHTAAECIQYLKEKRVGVATFLPLNTLRVPELDERLRGSISGMSTARLVIDVLKFEPEISKAVEYAAGSAMVTDTLDEARALRYGSGAGSSGLKVKVATVDGSLIDKSGFMTGGTLSRADGARAQRWARADMDALRRTRASALKELDALDEPVELTAIVPAVAAASGGIESSADDETGTEGQGRTTSRPDEQQEPRLSLREHEEALRAQIAQLERGAQFLQQDIDNSRDKTVRLERVLASAERELQSTSEQVQHQEQEQAALDEERTRVAEFEQRLAGMEEAIFDDFCSRVGVASVREFERVHVSRSEAFTHRRLALETQRHKLADQLAYERDRAANAELELRELEGAVRTAQLRVDALQEKRSRLDTARQKLQDELHELEEELRALTANLDDAQLLHAKLVKEHAAAAAELHSLRSTVVSLNGVRDELDTEKRSLLSECKVEQIRIPFVDDTNGSSVEENNDDDAMLIGMDREIEFGSLPRKLRDAALTSNATLRGKKRSEMEEQIKALSVRLEALAPNMRAAAGERAEDVAQRVAEAATAFEAARERHAELQTQFNAVRDERIRRFRACFDHVSGCVDGLYKQLTRSQAYPMGGTAHLSLEAAADGSLEPYSGGVKFNAMPPTKRFRDMDQLSGGERSVAALALLFAIHDFQPASFFVLDEVDAALDALNVSKLAAFFQRRSRTVQTIVISLKDAFYEKADALVGVYRDARDDTSHVALLDLSEFAQHLSGQSGPASGDDDAPRMDSHNADVHALSVRQTSDAHGGGAETFMSTPRSEHASAVMMT
ncbi:Structural maintenance of chromosomes protein 1 [Porphyridium purpureum]|uniref:Structural maintenance of chromosomes protein n=1 Tax=Porphyridium purpureum TaxID=35688 RepID=A0A5J4Z663_PORPP|nr:Structural maintenance of chromosomes protein 1 [Porphyridium purpureum]|eukprot:POR7002..scf295_1